MRLDVQGRVAEVRLLLDGEQFAALDSPPWAAPLRLGTALAPHELVARALDESGREVARARQWINMPRPPAEAEILLEHDGRGRARAARVAWQNLMGEEPSRVSVSFDGRPLAVDEARRVTLPSYAADVTHVLTVELDFASGLRSRDDVALGGGAGGEARSELTAVPLRLTKKRRLETATFQGVLSARERPLRVITAEVGSASLWIVRDESPLDAYAKLRRATTEGLGNASAPITLPLAREDAVRFLWPRPRAFMNGSVPAALFPSSQRFDRSAGGLAFLLGQIANTEPAGLFPMYTDAVAVAGLNAFESFGRRAVLLVLGDPAADASTHRPAVVRRYLELLRVPLFVWSLEKEAPHGTAWGDVEPVGTARGLRAAYARLRESLDAQRIVWVEGRHLPQDIATTEAAVGLELLR